MVIQQVVASPDLGFLTAAQRAGALPLALYHAGTTDQPGLGEYLLHAVTTLPQRPTVRAWDFLSIALAVFATDRMVLRSDFADGWTRAIDLRVQVIEPTPWQSQAAPLAAALRFLTGDVWHLRFERNGQPRPMFQPELQDRQRACLFSGGMDSLLGAIKLDLDGDRPYLVSQASPKEAQYQEFLAHRLGLQDSRFDGRVREKGRSPYEPSSRARSVLFFAYGALAACSLDGIVTVPENGLIAVNPPLSMRRIGSLSTRTTHPYFLQGLQHVFDQVGMGVRIENPFRHMTKGEMLAQCGRKDAGALAKDSYSCGKGKRLNAHCGRCIPCLIRRAAFHAAGVRDRTQYANADLSLAQNAYNDDVLTARHAVARLGQVNFERWVAAAGPLPSDARERQALIEVVERGLREVEAFLGTFRMP